MLQLTPKHKLFIVTVPVDFRCGINTLVSYCRCVLRCNPMSGHFFVFRNRSANALKVLVYDGQGFWLMQKRLSHGRFRYWPNQQQPVLQLTSEQTHVLMNNGNPLAVNTAPPWSPIND